MGFDNLQALDEEVFDDKGIKNEEQKQGVVKRGDKGFNQLVKVLKENTPIKGEIHRILLVEDEAGVKIGDSPEIVRLLFYSVEEGVTEHLPLHPFDPDKPMRDLKNWIEDSFRKQLAYWMMGLLVIWLLANSYMLYLLNRPMP
ncbi:hypothetical protein ACFLVW_02800 [Chloroflexota bacterium]